MVAQSARVALRDQSGQILVLTALSMAVLLGIAALTLDASFMFAKRNQLHAAADAAAKSGAIEIIRNNSVTQAGLEAFADQQVGAHGFVSTRLGGTTSVVVNRPPLSGPFAGNVWYVEVIASEPTGMFFGNILGWTSMTPGAVAVAGAGNPFACMIINQHLTIGNTAINMNGCGVGVGGNIYANNPNSRIVGTPTPTVGVTGTCQVRPEWCDEMGLLTTGAPAPVDPLAGLPLLANPGGCQAGTAPTLGPGCYTSIAATVTTLTPGEYYITGKVDIDNLTGTNVLLFLTGAGQLTAKQNKEIHLVAPTSGVYSGIAIFQDPANSNNFDAENNFLLDVTGAIYMPGTDVEFRNALTFASTTCTLFISRSLTIENGNGLVSNSGCAGLFGGAAYLTASIAQ